ncbi:phosphatidate phosphatase PAH2-like [Bidens hawaiensis]|uniref:phosphatidate phosphatase PAH2-like n=1 Tax=Bidens hawaiensis TaxID=980011 RepID=UPI00404916A6
MYAVGRLGSYITRGVSTVSGPFHPFGGAIDIIVVQQQDGTLKSSPWYVRFGKFQGVLKVKERVVDINVNGVAAGFHMYLNPKGEAYFLREGLAPESKGHDCDFGKCHSLISHNGESFSRTLGFTLERTGVNDDHLSHEDGKSAEIAAELLERKWSTNLKEHDKYDGEVMSGKLESSLVLHEEHFVHKPNDDNDTDHIPNDDNDIDGKVVICETSEGNLGNSGLNKEPSCAKVSSARKENVQDENSNGQLQRVAFKDVDERSLGSDRSPCIFDRDIIKGSLRKFPSDSDIIRSYKLMEGQNLPHTKSLPNVLCDFNGFDSSYWDMLRKDATRIIKYGFDQPLSKNGDTPNMVDDTGKSWSLWPFGKSKSRRLSQKEPAGKKDLDLDNGSEAGSEKDNLPKPKKIHYFKGVTPTPEELQSLNLNEGKNTVTFKFSTAVLGNQQVDARIFLWRSDTRIVISDVDGTITKSDVLGQFMPLMGKDWSHIGVTNLFSAIKENGYQLLFLSARSISQADVTRQFLINLKQDGKTLPEGPVVISPDGLFPSLFREVIRRAPHEFKIACLEDIRVCFPADWNPFYAGFGNRDTDEFSYLKVGIPKGRIFIINPKGEVAVNRSNETKSYNSIRSIVNGIFPPKSEEEQAQEQEQKGEVTQKVFIFF